MRTIDDIKADIEKVKKVFVEGKPLSHALEVLIFVEGKPLSHALEVLITEWRGTLTDGIPLDRLEEICAAENEGRLMIMDRGLFYAQYLELQKTFKEEIQSILKDVDQAAEAALEGEKK